MRISATRARLRTGKARHVGMHTALPSLSKVGTVCGKAASTGLCGGRAAMRVPTATPISPPLAAQPKPKLYKINKIPYRRSRSEYEGK